MVCLNHTIAGFLMYASSIKIFQKKNLNSFERSWSRDQYFLFSLKEGKIQFIWAWLCCHFEIRSRKSRVANPESGMLVRSGPVYPSRIQLRVIWPVLLRLVCKQVGSGPGFFLRVRSETGFPLGRIRVCSRGYQTHPGSATLKRSTMPVQHKYTVVTHNI